MNEPQTYTFLVYPVVIEDLGPEFAYIDEYIACMAADTNDQGLPHADATMSEGKTPYEAIRNLCHLLAERDADKPAGS